MKGWTLRFVESVDWLSTKLGAVAAWAIFLSCAVSAVTALVRYGFNVGSDGWSELQWYLFAATVFFGAPFLMLVNEHVRVDIFYATRSGRGKAITDLLGLLVLYMPVCVAMTALSLNLAHDSWVQQEISSSTGGLIRWPVKALIPLGFALLVLQGVSEILKRIAFLRGTYAMDTHYEKPLQ